LTAYARLLASGLALGGQRPNGLALLIRSPDFQLSSEPVPFPLSLLSMMEIPYILSFLYCLLIIERCLAERLLCSRIAQRMRWLLPKYVEHVLDSVRVLVRRLDSEE
jgi:hypothetical protein